MKLFFKIIVCCHMGYIKHHTIIVTSLSKEYLAPAHEAIKAIVAEEFVEDISSDSSQMVSPIVDGVINSQCSFFVAPDGSKEGWETSDCGNRARDRIVETLEKEYDCCDYVEVMFGGDDHHQTILRSSNQQEED
jgi:hypothetical protein